MDATQDESTRSRRPRTPVVIPERVARRAAAAYVVGADGCWISTYSVGSHGYAQIGWHEDGRIRTTTAHRAAWVLAHGVQIPEGMTVDHLCYVRRCVNPEHLRVLSNPENARRTGGRDWPLGECANGHPNDRRVMRGGKRVCRDCAIAWNRAYEERKGRARATEGAA